MVRRWLDFAPFLILCTVGCAAAEFQVGNAWQPGEERFFDDGVDMVGDPSKISGKWAYEQQDELTGRVQLADLIARVEILSVQTHRNIDGIETKRLTVEIVEIKYGHSPEQQLSLASLRDAPGHTLIQRYEKRLTGHFILFIRWFETDDGSLGHHFHLSPATSIIESEVQKRINERLKQESTSQGK